MGIIINHQSSIIIINHQSSSIIIIIIIYHQSSIIKHQTSIIIIIIIKHQTSIIIIILNCQSIRLYYQLGVPDNYKRLVKNDLKKMIKSDYFIDEYYLCWRQLNYKNSLCNIKTCHA